MIAYQLNLTGISAAQLEGFFVGWPDPPSPDTHLRILENSAHVVLALEGGRVIGFVSAISDGVLSAYISLLEVLPDHQGRGAGRELMIRMNALLEGLAVRGEAVLGVVYNPAKLELVAGASGLGVTLNGVAVTTTQISSVGDARLLVSSSEWRAGLNALETRLPIQPISSIAYKLGLVAAGLADGTFTANARFEWDVCAGVALVAAAGGVASLRDGSSIVFNQRNPRLGWGILAAGSALYGPLLADLQDLPTAAWAAMRRRE